MTYTVTISYTTESERSDDKEEVRTHYIDMMRNGEITVDDFEIDIMEYVE